MAYVVAINKNAAITLWIKELVVFGLSRLPVQSSPPHWFFLSEFVKKNKKNPHKPTNKPKKPPSMATICSSSQLICPNPSQRADGRKHIQRVSAHNLEHASGKIRLATIWLRERLALQQTAQPQRLLAFSKSNGEERLISEASRICLPESWPLGRCTERVGIHIFQPWENAAGIPPLAAGGTPGLKQPRSEREPCCCLLFQSQFNSGSNKLLRDQQVLKTLVSREAFPVSCPAMNLCHCPA